MVVQACCGPSRDDAAGHGVIGAYGPQTAHQHHVPAGHDVSRDMVCLLLLWFASFRCVLQSHYHHFVREVSASWKMFVGSVVFDPRNGRSYAVDLVYSNARSGVTATSSAGAAHPDLTPSVFGVLSFLCYLLATILVPILMALPTTENNLLYEPGAVSVCRALLFMMAYMLADKLFPPADLLRGHNAAMIFAFVSCVFFIHRFLLPVVLLHLLVAFVVYVRFIPEQSAVGGERDEYAAAAMYEADFP
jgi:hypothetical protein